MMPMGSAPLSMLGAQILVDALRDLQSEPHERENVTDAPSPKAATPRRSLWPQGILRHILPQP